MREREEGICFVCGARARGGLCDCCRESLALCDMENYITRKSARGNYADSAANAFKNEKFMVKYPKNTGTVAHETFCGERPASAGEPG